MVPIKVPASPGEPILWWLFWFAVSVVVYAVLMVWFYRTGKREIREPGREAGHDRGPTP